jgi:hypothetical protein
MAGRKITGIAFDGKGASWVSLDFAAGTGPKVEANKCALDVSVSEVISLGGEQAVAAGEKLKESLGAVKGDVAVSLPSDQVLLRILELPTADPAEIKSMVDLQIDKVSPFPVENMVVAHEVVGRRDSGTLVAAIAVRRDLVHNASELLRAANIVPARVDVNSLVWWKLIKASGSVAAEGRQVFILFGEHGGEFAVVSSGMPLLFRAFVRHEGQADVQFMDEVCDELGYALMSLELEHGTFTDFSISLWYAGIPDEQALARPQELSGGRLEIKSMDMLPGLAEGVAGRCQEPGAIDLTPGDLIDERNKRVFRKKMLKALAGAGAVWLISLAVLFGGVAFQKYRLNGVKAEIGRISGEAMEVRELRRKVRTISLYTDRSRSALECLREVSLRQPGGVELTTLNYRKAESIKVGGEATDVNQVYEFKKNIDESELFESVTIDGPKKVRGKEVFEIEAMLPGGGE